MLKLAPAAGKELVNGGRRPPNACPCHLRHDRLDMRGRTVNRGKAGIGFIQDKLRSVPARTMAPMPSRRSRQRARSHSLSSLSVDVRPSVATKCQLCVMAILISDPPKHRQIEELADPRRVIAHAGPFDRLFGWPATLRGLRKAGLARSLRPRSGPRPAGFVPGRPKANTAPRQHAVSRWDLASPTRGSTAPSTDRRFWRRAVSARERRGACPGRGEEGAA